jgi:hypothetical protein
MTDDLETRLANLTARVDANERELRTVRREVHEHEEDIDTMVRTPFWKRIRWRLQGFSFYKVDR